MGVSRIASIQNWSPRRADKRMDGWPLMDSPVPTLLLTAAYLVFVLLGPTIMRGSVLVSAMRRHVRQTGRRGI